MDITSVLTIIIVATCSIGALVLYYFYHRKTVAQLAKCQEEQKTDKNNTDIELQRKSKFIISAAHDLRQPLQALSLFSNALIEQPLNPCSQDIAIKINQSVNALTEQFNTLFDVSKIESGFNRANIQDFSIKHILQQIHNEYQAHCKVKGLTWQCDMNDCYVRSDPVLLETVVRNLVSNALRYTSQGSIGLRVTESNSNILIAVFDTGIGIAKPLQKEIFNEFHQLGDSTRMTLTGLGLGLSIVDRLINLLGHTISIDSDVGEGTVFILKISAGRKSTEQAALHTTRPITDIAKLKVLIIDDDPVIRESMQLLLSNWQCHVFSAATVNQVTSMFNQKHFSIDVIISDYRLSKNVTGLDLLESLSKYREINVPVLFISADSSKQTLNTIRGKNYPFLRKPIQPAQLRSFLRSVVRNKTKSHSAGNKAEISVDRIIRGVIKELELQISQKKLIITNRCASVNAYSHHDMLEAIMRHLLKNSLNRTHHGEIVVSSRMVNGNTTITVQDRGERISPELIDSLTNNTSIAHKITPNKSANIGISIAYELARQLQHQIDITFDIQRGNQISVKIPSNTTIRT